MSGRHKTYSVELTQTEARQLQQLVDARKSPQSIAKRAKVILKGAEYPDWTDAQVAESVGCFAALVRKWRKRWSQTRNLKEAPRSGRPRTFLPIVRSQVTAIACSKPADYNVPLARWSCSDIAAQLVTLGVVVAIASSTVWRWLKAEHIKPWRFHAWMHQTDENFVAKATPILQLYAQASFVIKSRFWVVCVDEKTSIQARARLHPTVPATSGQPVHVASRYKRQGALHLFAALSVADGVIYGCCRDSKKFVDFQTFVLEVLVSEAIRRGVRHIYLILDNGSTHAAFAVAGVVKPKAGGGWLELYCRGGVVAQVCLLVRSN